MPTIPRIDIDQETYERLVGQAVREKRPIHFQAEVALRRAMGLPFPPAAVGDAQTLTTVSAQESAT